MLESKIVHHDPKLIVDHFPLSEKFSDGGQTQHKFVRGELFEKLDDGYGGTILNRINSNTVVIGGAILALQKLTGVEPQFVPPALNEKYGINTTGTLTGNNKIALFGCGIGGSGLEFGDVKDNTITQIDVMGGLVPMRYGTELTGVDADKYYFKSTNDEGISSWYLKEFDPGTVIKTLWKNSIDAEEDGTEITTDVSESDSTDGIESFVEFNISLNTNDIREYYEAKGQLSKARYNTFGFFTGEKVNGEYANVRLFSVVNFNNRDVSMKTTSSFLYRVYTLV